MMSQYCQNFVDTDPWNLSGHSPSSLQQTWGESPGFTALDWDRRGGHFLDREQSTSGHCPSQTTFGHCPSQGYSLYPIEAPPGQSVWVGEYPISHSYWGFKPELSANLQRHTKRRGIKSMDISVQSGYTNGTTMFIIIHSSVLLSNHHHVISIFSMGYSKTHTSQMCKTYIATAKMKIMTPHNYQNICHLTHQNQSGQTYTESSSSMLMINIGLHKNVSPF